MAPPSVSGLDNIRNLLGMSDRERVPPDLKRALSSLGLRDLAELEKRVLSLDAFLKPWSIFRDSIFLQQAEAISRATIITKSADMREVSRLDILWFYTKFDEGALRYDPRADKNSPEYTLDSNVHGVIDKSAWRVEEYEKHLYAWLLQEFKVGKAYSPWNFRYLQLKNICTAWENVFVPIVNAVRASYSSKGRRHYGRLALYIEERCPSGLAFPNGNVHASEGGPMSPTPFRVVSIPKKLLNNEGATFPYTREQRYGLLSKKHYDDTEKELRDVYPQYGGLVERPRFKQKMEEWLDEQRARAARRKVLDDTAHVQPRERKDTKGDASEKPVNQLLRTLSLSKRDGSERQSVSSFKRYSENFRRSLSINASHKGSPPLHAQRSSLHSIKHQPRLSDRIEVPADKSREFSAAVPAKAELMPVDQSLYTPIHKSSLTDLENIDTLKQYESATSNDSNLSLPCMSTAGLPQKYAPLHHQYPVLPKKHLLHDSRVLSYEGSEYQDEISLNDLHAARKAAARTPQPPIPVQAPRNPIPIAPVPYGGRYRTTSNESARNLSPQVSSRLPPFPKLPIHNHLGINKSYTAKPQSFTNSDQATSRSKLQEWGSTTPPRAVAWPGFESDDEDEISLNEIAPPVPAKSPERRNLSHARGHTQPNPIVQEDALNVHRIVSKENIRSALGNVSRESLVDDLLPPRPLTGTVRAMGPARSLHTYNTHLFPRKETRPTLSQGRKDTEGGEASGSFEMQVLETSRDSDDGNMKVFI